MLGLSDGLDTKHTSLPVNALPVLSGGTVALLAVRWARVICAVKCTGHSFAHCETLPLALFCSLTSHAFRRKNLPNTPLT